MGRFLYPKVFPAQVIMSNIYTLALILLSSLYPAVKASKMTPADAMRFN
jgi:ABC-type lipoprotein release transport system permease subunit